MDQDHPAMQVGAIHGPLVAPPRFPDRLRLRLSFDPGLLARDLDRLSGDTWTRHYVRQNYDGDWSVIPLRAPVGETHPVRMINADPAARSYVDTPFLAGCDYFRQVLDGFRCTLRSVRLMRLGPGACIKEHTDHELSFEDGTVRVHIPVVTHDAVEFYLNKTRVVLEAGSAWYLRLSDPHSVVNRGSLARVHMVVDAEVNPWIEALLESAAAQPGPLPAACAGARHSSSI
jgi:hypothetical protein